MMMKGTTMKYLIAGLLLQQVVGAAASSNVVEPEQETTYASLRTSTNHRHRSLFAGDFLDDVWTGFLGLFGVEKTCPPPGFDALQEFDFDEYISAAWYVAKQIPVAYQPVDSLFCVRAEYIPDDSFCLFCNDKPRVVINNSAARESATGEQIGGDPSTTFRGIVRHPDTEPAKVSVGFLPDLLVWDATYWVVAAGTYEELVPETTDSSTSDIDWAIVLGGAPKKEGANGKCLPDPGLLNFNGFWLFVRTPDVSSEVVAAMEAYARDELGLDTSVLLDVVQDGCTYPASELPP